MPTVTALKPQKRNNRVNVYLDGKFGFGIDLDNLVKLGIGVEKVLSEGEVEEIVKQAEFQGTFDKLLRFATLRPRSNKEVLQWFSRRKVHDSLREGLKAKLEDLDLLNDEKFAAWWVEQRLSFRPKSRRILKYELKSKGIDNNIIEDVLYKAGIDEVKIAKRLLEKQHNKSEDKKAAYLARRGFGWDVIRRVVK